MVSKVSHNAACVAGRSVRWQWCTVGWNLANLAAPGADFVKEIQPKSVHLAGRTWLWTVASTS